MIHAAAWLIWLSAALVAVSLTRNPLYLTLLTGGFVVVARTVRRPGEALAAPLAPGRFALVVIPLAALFNALLSRTGATVLLAIPAAWPLIGGPITAEALVYGATNGLALAALFAAFTVLNLAVPVRDLIRFVPRAFYPVAVVASIAVTFVPATLRQMQQIRDAQAIRGHRMRKLRDWLPLFMPLLTGGLERALQLAEAMASRGFAGTTESSRDVLAQAATVAGLLCILGGGLVQAMGGPAVWGSGLLVVGSAIIGSVLWRAGRRVKHTTFRRAVWSRPAWIVAGGALLAVTVLLWGGDTRSYEAYPAIAWPPFDPLVGTALLGFLSPLLVLGEHNDPL